MHHNKTRPASSLWNRLIALPWTSERGPFDKRLEQGNGWSSSHLKDHMSKVHYYYCWRCPNVYKNTHSIALGALLLLVHPLHSVWLQRSNKGSTITKLFTKQGVQGIMHCSTRVSHAPIWNSTKNSDFLKKALKFWNMKPECSLYTYTRVHFRGEWMLVVSAV